MASDKAALLTAVGAMLIPIAITWELEAPMEVGPFWRWGVALIIGFIGLVFIISGWSGIKAEEKRRLDEKDERDEQRKLDEQLKQEEHIEYLTTLRVIAKQLGANPVVTRRKSERAVERFREERGLGDEL